MIDVLWTAVHNLRVIGAVVLVVAAAVGVMAVVVAGKGRR